MHIDIHNHAIIINHHLIYHHAYIIMIWIYDAHICAPGIGMGIYGMHHRDIIGIIWACMRAYRRPGM